MLAGTVCANGVWFGEQKHQQHVQNARLFLNGFSFVLAVIYLCE